MWVYCVYRRTGVCTSKNSLTTNSSCSLVNWLQLIQATTSVRPTTRAATHQQQHVLLCSVSWIVCFSTYGIVLKFFRLYNASKSDMMWSCAVVCVLVVSPQFDENNNEGVFYAWLGKRGNLTCTARAEPEPALTWYDPQGQEIQDSNVFTIVKAGPYTGHLLVSAHLCLV